MLNRVYIKKIVINDSTLSNVEFVTLMLNDLKILLFLEENRFLYAIFTVNYVKK